MELKKFETPSIEVRELEDIPDQWRRARLAWLCKELPAHRTPTMVRILNAQRKWFRQEDGSFVAVHCMRIRENEAAFRVMCSFLLHLCPVSTHTSTQINLYRVEQVDKLRKCPMRQCM